MFHEPRGPCVHPRLRRLYREGLTQCLAGAETISVVGSVADPATALKQIRDLRPDVVLIDVGMAHGLPTACIIRGDLPCTKIIASVVSEVGADIVFWAQAGISGYITREEAIADLASMIKRAARGEIVCPPHVVASLLDGLATKGRAAPQGSSASAGLLTMREREIAQLITEGMSNKEIARLLSISLPTVKNHVHNVLGKLHVERRSDAARHIRPPEDLSG